MSDHDTYSVGDRVRITVNETKLIEITETHVGFALDGFHHVLPRSLVTLEYALPEEWPPQPGDLWNCDGSRWYFYRASDPAPGIRGNLCRRNSQGDWHEVTDLVPLAEDSRWQLVYREPSPFDEEPPF